jgi:hypothetical protein
MRSGLYHSETMSLRECALRIGRTNSRARTIESEAMESLRAFNPALADEYTRTVEQSEKQRREDHQRENEVPQLSPDSLNRVEF